MKLLTLRCRSLAALASLACVFVSSSAFAQAWGNFSGSTVDFIAVTETTQLAVDPTDPLILFGAPTVSLDQLVFNPTAFTASASGANDIDQTLSLLSFDIVSTVLGTYIETINIHEAGDSILSGPTGTGGTGTFVSVSGVISVLEVNGAPIVQVDIPINGVFAPTDTFGLPVFAGAVNWTGDALIDIASLVPNATRVHVAMNNYLVAASEGALNAATIQKKLSRGVVITVPEPGSFALIGLGLLFSVALGARTRRD